MTDTTDHARAALQERLGYRFNDPELLATALTHSSAAAEKGVVNNQRLEFLGDAVLDLAVSELLMKILPDEREGGLTRVRASVVSASSLADVAGELGVGPCLALGRGETRSGGREKPGILADALEAVIAAIFLDANYERAAKVVAELLTDRLVSAHTRVQDSKTRLQELTQELRRITPTYRVVEVSGPDHAPSYRVEVLLGDDALAAGEGSSRKEAEQVAARAAIERLLEAKAEESATTIKEESLSGAGLAAADRSLHSETEEKGAR